jgi:acetoin:2,6-dichlorophenolindophenol oxidoreductase subunit beta
MKTYLETAANTFKSLMLKNKRCIYIGEDVRSGQRGISDGFVKIFGKDRVVDTPISESAFCGYAVGLAINGFRPIVEFNFAGLIFVSLDQIFNQASKFKQMSGNKKDVPILYILPTGTKGGLAGHHSDNPYSVLAHLGIKSYMPTHVNEVSPIIKYAYKEKEPIALFLPVEEFRNKYNFKVKTKYPSLNLLIKSILKDKLSIICTGTTISKCLGALNSIKISQRKMISFYSLSDLSFSEITKKKLIKIKSKKILIVDDSPGMYGLSAQIELILRKSRNFTKDGIVDLSRKSNFIPFNQPLENIIRPSEKTIKKTILKLLK